MKNTHTITASLLLVATLAGCSHFTPPDPDRFKYEPAKDWPNGPRNAPVGNPVPTLRNSPVKQPGDPGYYRD